MLGLFSDILSTFPDESSVSVQEPNVTVNSYVFNKFSVKRIVFFSEPIKFLLSEGSSYVNGIVLPVDGGFSI